MRISSLVTTAVLSAVLGTASTTAAAQNLVLGHGAASDNPRALAAERMASLAQEYSDGEISIQIQGSEQLGSDVQMIQQLQSGALGLTANSQGAMANFVPQANVFGLPFLFESPEAAWEVVDGPVGDKVAEIAEQRGLKVLAWWDNGFRQITNNRRAIESPEDLRGLRIRTPEDAMTISILERLGASPTPLAFGELYVALRQGAVDGQENPLVNIIASNLDEVQDHLAMVDYQYQTTPVLVGIMTWQRLSENAQEALLKSAEEARDYQRELMVAQNDELLEKIQEEGSMQVSFVDTVEFRELTAPVYEHWQGRLGDIVAEAQEAAERANGELSSGE